MNEQLRDRILRKLETLSDERMYQVLDYVEFLEARYAERPEAATSVFTRFAEVVEDRLRAGRVSASAVAETMSLMNRAMGVLGGVAAAGKSVANDIVDATRQAGRTADDSTPPSRPPTPAQPPASSGGTQAPPGEQRS